MPSADTGMVSHMYIRVRAVGFCFNAVPFVRKTMATEQAQVNLGRLPTEPSVCRKRRRFSWLQQDQEL
jgi:hypothetical protein